MTKMVIFNLRQSTERIGGAEVVIRRTVSGLDKDRFHVYVVCLKKPGMDLSAVKTSLMDVGATYIELESRALLDFRALKQIGRMLREYRPNIVHCHDPKTDFIGFLLRFLKPGLPLVTTLHGWVVASQRGVWYKRMDQFFARFFHAAVAVSPLIEEEALQKGIKRVQLIENGIPVRAWREKAAHQKEPPVPKLAEEQWVGFLGRLTPEKGPLEFIEAAILIADRIPAARFVVAGEGPLAQAMEKRADEAGLLDRCRFLGQLALGQVPGFLNNLDVLLSTSETEGIPNALLEAGALGIPIVATAVGGVPRVVVDGETGFLAPYKAHAQLADGVSRLLTDANLHRRFSVNAAAWIESEFSIEVTAGKLADLYEHLCRS